MSPLRQFTYQAITPQGQKVTDSVEGQDRADALTRLANLRLVVLTIAEVKAGGVLIRRKSGLSERILVLRQLAVMTRAGVDLLEALDIVASTLPPGKMLDELNATVASLRRGERLAAAFAQNISGYPLYVQALIAAGEATGKLGKVMSLAADEVAYEKKSRDEIVNALTYPALLIAAGTLVLGVLFYAVVPTFADMLESQRASLGPVEQFVFSIGRGLRAHPVAILIGLALFMAAAIQLSANAGLRAKLLRHLEGAPVVGALVLARRRMNWARIMAIATQSGVALLDAAQLAYDATPDGPFKSRLLRARQDLRNGRSVEEAFFGALERIDAGLLKVGQRTATLGEVFGIIADRHEGDFRNSVKRFTAILEPVAVGIVAFLIGTVALSLVSAMTSLYDAIG